MTTNKEINKLEEERKELNNSYYTLRNATDCLDIQIANKIGAWDSVFQLKKMVEAKEKEIIAAKESKKSPVRFLLHSVTNGSHKAKVWYSLSSDQEGNEYIWVYAKNYNDSLCDILPNVQNETDTMTDYFEKDRVKITIDSPYWKSCKATYDKVQDAMKRKAEKRLNLRK